MHDFQARGTEWVEEARAVDVLAVDIVHPQERPTRALANDVANPDGMLDGLGSGRKMKIESDGIRQGALLSRAHLTSCQKRVSSRSVDGSRTSHPLSVELSFVERPGVVTRPSAILSRCESPQLRPADTVKPLDRQSACP